MRNKDIIKVELEVNQVPSIIQEQFNFLKVLNENVHEATQKAELAQTSAQAAKEKSAGALHRKDAIESLQSAAVDLAYAQISAAQAQKVSFAYQQRLGEITKYLLGLGVSNIAMNRSIVRELEMKLKGASEEELDEFARQEIINVIKQLKAQEDIMKKLCDLSDRVKEHDSILKSHEEHKKKQDDLLKEHSEKGKEHDRLLSNLEKTNKEQNDQINELQSKCASLEEILSHCKKDIDVLEKSVNEKVETKASKISNEIALIVAIAALGLAVAQLLI